MGDQATGNIPRAGALDLARAPGVVRVCLGVLLVHPGLRDRAGGVPINHGRVSGPLMLVRISGRDNKGTRFCAGLVLEAGKVVRVAPKLYFMRDWRYGPIQSYCERRRWKFEVVEQS